MSRIACLLPEAPSLTPPGAQPGPPLGVRQNASYPVFETGLARGDLILFYTDGLYEATGPAQEPYGEERLHAAVQARLRLPAGRLFDELLDEVLAFTAGRGFADDVCLLGMEVIRSAEE